MAAADATASDAGVPNPTTTTGGPHLNTGPLIGIVAASVVVAALVVSLLVTLHRRRQRRQQGAREAKDLALVFDLDSAYPPTPTVMGQAQINIPAPPPPRNPIASVKTQHHSARPPPVIHVHDPSDALVLQHQHQPQPMAESDYPRTGGVW